MRRKLLAVVSFTFLFLFLVFEIRQLNLAVLSSSSLYQYEYRYAYDAVTTPKELQGVALVGADTAAHNETLGGSREESTNGRTKMTRNIESSTAVDKSSQEGQQHETFSACILTMDDYPILTEWLAYHYHVLPLRYVIVAVDPRSSVSPSPIFDIWRRHGMIIEEWSDEDFFPQAINDPLADDAPHRVKYDRHLVRQKWFYQACIDTLREKNRTWTSLHDTDEFIRFNTRDMERGTFGIIPEPLPSVEEPGSIMRFIKTANRTQFSHQKGWEAWAPACITIPRLFCGSKESTTEEQMRFEPSSMQNVSQRLDTQRFRYNSGSHLKKFQSKDGLGKVIMDVSRIPSGSKVQGVHRPIPSQCPQPFLWIPESLFVINHNKGSYERYTFRDDARGHRSYEAFQNRTDGMTAVSDDIRPWLKGFVRAQGVETARKLLEEAGRFPQKGKWTI